MNDPAGPRYSTAQHLFLYLSIDTVSAPLLSHTMTDEKMLDTAPRKRSKVSRACDACRRKKVKCDGDFSTTHNQVIKKCTNCHKNHDTCTFLRVPLKRGPSKGYIRDLEEKLEHSRPRKLSLSSATTGYTVGTKTNGFSPPNSHSHSTSSSSSSDLMHPSSIPIHLQHLPYPQHQASNSNSSSKSNISTNSGNPPPTLANPIASTSISSKQGTSPIILPPLIGTFPHVHSQIAVDKNNNTTTNNNSNNTNNNNNLKPGSNNNIDPISPASPRNGNFNSILNPTSHGSAAGAVNNPPQTESPRIQGPFWKVPYEMPSNSSVDNRRSSIESISSANSSASGILIRSRLPSLKASVSASETGISDSEDDFYSVKSFSRSRSSQSLSPRNSVSSMSSLNGRIGNVNIGQNPQIPPQGNQLHQVPPFGQQNPILGPHAQMQSLPQAPPPRFSIQHQQQQQQTAGYQPMYAPSFQFMPGNHPYQQPGYAYSVPVQNSQHQQQQPQPPQGPYNNLAPFNQLPHISPPPASLEHNLNVYYIKFHGNFPILPFNESHIKSLLESLTLDDSTKLIVDLFNCSLNNLNNYNSINLRDNIVLLNKILSMYPFNSFNAKLSDNLLIFFFSSLILINYSILLNGDIYSIGLGVTISILNDFKVLEKFAELTSGGDQKIPSSDSVQIYLPKIYLCTMILDSIYSLGFAVQKTFPIENALGQNLISNMDKLVPKDCQLIHGIGNFKLMELLNDLINLRDKRKFVDSSINWNRYIDNGQRRLFPSYFIELTKDKSEVLNYLNEIAKDLPSMDEETLHDFQLKLCRIVKKLTASIVNLANYIPTNSSNSTIMSIQSSNNTINSTNFSQNELTTPLLNISFGQSYKLIKLSKLITDSMVKTTNDNELFNRCLKINNDLSIANNLLNSNLNTKNPIIGSMALNLIKSKLEYYDLNLGSPISNQMAGLGIDVWKSEYMKIIQFIEREYIEGWF